jgi:hypothetical protein
MSGHIGSYFVLDLYGVAKTPDLPLLTKVSYLAQ